MAGGQRIDDHKFWAGGKSEGSVFPKGAHIKKVRDAEHDGHLSTYEDTAEAIERQQDMGVKKAKGHAQKSGHRN